MSDNALRILRAFSSVDKITDDERSKRFSSDADQEAFDFLVREGYIAACDFDSSGSNNVFAMFSTAHAITEEGRAFLDKAKSEKRAAKKEDRRWRITTTIAVAALIVAIIALLKP